MTTEQIDKQDQLKGTDDGDHDLFAHYVRKADLDLYWLNGVPLTALCGKTWMPNKDFSKYPVCPECKEKFEAMRDE